MKDYPQNMHAKPPDFGNIHHAGGVRKGFPERWGPKPVMRSKDIVVWPGGYGRGSSTMASWIRKNMAKDVAQGIGDNKFVIDVGQDGDKERKPTPGLPPPPYYSTNPLVKDTEESKAIWQRNRNIELMDAWLKEKGLNRYGELKGTMYKGGNPLFNESTGESRDRYEYVKMRHFHEPWIARMVTFGVTGGPPATIGNINEEEEDAVEEEDVVEEEGMSTGVIVGITAVSIVTIIAIVIMMRRLKR
tara:strand:- start:1670 stop:2404 length:735 start_codon:yes stop_codon:yes gene_type:complete